VTGQEGMGFDGEKRRKSVGKERKKGRKRKERNEETD
jgi:hypothetical protein